METKTGETIRWCTGCYKAIRGHRQLDIAHTVSDQLAATHDHEPGDYHEACCPIDGCNPEGERP